MIINSLLIKDGYFEKKYEFEKGFNLIHSTPNSVGKTTLLRSLIYAMGYPIPGTKKFPLTKPEFTLNFQLESGETAQIVRKDREVSFNDDFFVVPAEQLSLQKSVFELNDEILLSNLLGVFYVDQEKGWTLLNRGKVIGNVRFNIYDFILSLTGKHSENLSRKLDSLNRAIAKYKNFQNIVEYQSTLNEEHNFVMDSSRVALEKDKTLLEYKKRASEKEVSILKRCLKDQNSFVNFIDSLQLSIKLEDGRSQIITKENLIGVEENKSLIKARIELLADEICSYTQNLSKIDAEIEKADSDLSLIEVETLESQYDRQISSLNMNQSAVKGALTSFEKQRKEVEEEMDVLAKTDTSVIDRIHTIIYGYAQELDVVDYTSPSQDYIFTSDLKSLSGAIFHKIVFCFKLAYVRLVEEKCNCNLPIILDSPSGREVSEENVRKMMEILKRDFSNHQIIIASIHDFGYADKVIEIKETLMEDAEKKGV